MRLLYVLDRFPVLSETFVLREVRGLLAAGEDVVVYARHGGEPGVADDLRELVVRPRRGLAHGALRVAGEVAWLAKAVRADRAHAHFAFGSASVALLYGRLAGVPASFTAHAHDLYGGVGDGALRRKVAMAAWAAAPSEHGARSLRDRAAPRDWHKIGVQRNGVDRDAVEVGPPDVPPRVIGIGRLVEKKGFDVLVRCAAGLEADVEIVGDGPQRARLEALAGGRVRFSGALSHDAALARLRGASAFVLPCRELASGDRDGLPVALVEAMCAGVPVVTTPVGGIPELVRDGETGLLVAPDDDAALAAAIARALADPGELATAGRAATEPWDAERCIAALRARFAS